MERVVKYGISCGLSAPGEQTTSPSTRVTKDQPRLWPNKGHDKRYSVPILYQTVSSCASSMSMSRKGRKKYVKWDKCFCLLGNVFVLVQSTEYLLVTGSKIAFKVVLILLTCKPGPLKSYRPVSIDTWLQDKQRVVCPIDALNNVKLKNLLQLLSWNQ